MKKMQVLIILFISQILYAETQLTKAQCFEDFEELKIHLTQDSISYENIIKSNRFNYEKCFLEIHDSIKKKRDGMSGDEFFNLLYKNLRGLPDHHIAFLYDNDYFDLGLHETFFLGEDEESLQVPSLTSKMNGTFRKQSVFKNEQSQAFNENFKEINISSPNQHKIITTKNQIYIRIPNFDDNFKEDLNRFSSSGKFAQKKDFIIIDLINNNGGGLETFIQFLFNFFEINHKHRVEGSDLCTRFLMTENILSGAENLSIPNWFKILFKIRKTLNKSDKIYFGKPFFKGKLRIFKGRNKFTGQIVLIGNRQTASAAECMILYFREYFSNVIFIGENTSGVFCYANPLYYELPNSKIKIQIPNAQTIYSKNTTDGLDPESGLVPDYWCDTEQSTINTLQILGVEEELYSKIKAFYESK